MIGEGEGRQQRHDHHLEHPQPHVIEPLQDAERRLRHEHDVGHAAGDRAGATVRDRPGAVERHRPLAAGRQARRRRVAAGEGPIDFGSLDPPWGDQDRLGRGRARLARRQPPPAAAQPGAGAIGPPPAQHADFGCARAGRVLASVEAGNALRVGDDAAAGRDDPEPHVRGLLEPIEQALQPGIVGRRGQARRLGQRGGEQPRLLHHGALLLIEQVLLVGVEVPQPGDRQEDQQCVEQQQPDGEPGVSARQPRRPRADAAHRSSVRSR